MSVLPIGGYLEDALPELRAHAESLMLDRCKITSPAESTWDEATGTHIPGIPETVFEGRCQLPKVEPSGQLVTPGDAVHTVALVQIKLPMTAAAGETGDPLAVAEGHDVDVLSRPGLRMTVRAVHPQTFEKSRKVSCEAVSRDAD